MNHMSGRSRIALSTWLRKRIWISGAPGMRTIAAATMTITA
jgi:hypothetical protein